MTGARGEYTLTAGEREVQILFTNRALADVEQQLARSIVSIMQAMSDGDISIMDTVLLLRAGMDAARRDARLPGPPVAINTAYAVMDEVGFGQVAAAVMEAAADVLTYGQADEGEGDDPNPP